MGKLILTIVASLAVLAGEPSLAQSLRGPFNPPPLHQDLGPSRPYPDSASRPKRRAQSQQRTTIAIPQPESTPIDAKYAKGSIVIVNHERQLYYVDEPGRAIRYPVAIGTDGDQWEGSETVTAKRENPRWFPSEDIQWETGVPPMVPPGPENPLGPRALYLGNTLYRIHGTNRPASIGGAVSHGCFRMFNQHIIELYEKVQIGANVYVEP